MSIRPSGLKKRDLIKQSPTFSLARNLNVQPRVPYWWAKEVKPGRGVVVCPICQAVYYQKHWHTWSNASTRIPLSGILRRKLCLACDASQNQKTKTAEFGYGGEIILSGLRANQRKLNILQLVRNTGRRAVLRDPEDQIIKIEDKGKTVRITTSENQLAVSIAKQIDSAFKGGELKISWSNDDLPVHIKWKDTK